MEKESDVSTLRLVLMTFLVIIIIASLVQTFFVLSTLNKITAKAPELSSTTGEVKLYVEPKPVSQDAQVKLIVKGKSQNENNQ